MNGISRYGKNFPRIQKELLPQKNTVRCFLIFLSRNFFSSLFCLRDVARRNSVEIKAMIIPQKDIVDFYYAWKWSESAKKLRNCRRRRRTNAKRRFPSIGCIFGELSSPKIVTRSMTTRLSLQKNDQSLNMANLAKCSKAGVRKRRNGSLAVR